MEPILRVDNIAIAFGGVKAVQGASFEIGKGEVLGLIGPNGSGKSTIVNMISGVYKCDSGNIWFDGHDIPQKLSMADRARMGITRTFQSPKPFANLTVYQNIFTSALQRCSFKEAAERTDWVLHLTQLAPLAELLSAKLPIEKRKWLDLARILAIEPKLIMMDEVMGGLNPSEMEQSLELVRQINKEGVTVLFIEHVMKAVVNICTRSIVLVEGKVMCSGEPQEVLKRDDVLEAYLGKGGQKHA